MSYILGINYDEMRAVASELDRCADTASMLGASGAQQGEVLLADWDGMASLTYDAQLRASLERMARAPALLRKVAGSLRVAADRIWQAEQEAARMLREQGRL